MKKEWENVKMREGERSRKIGYQLNVKLKSYKILSQTKGF